MHLAAKLAVYEVYMAASIDPLPVTCTTGTCTWPIQPTVGACGACVSLPIDVQVSGEGPVASYDISAGKDMRLKDMCEHSSITKIAQIGNSTGHVFSATEGAPSNENSSQIITTFGVLGLLASNTNLDEAVAYECALWFCVQSRRVKVVEGELSDDLVETWTKMGDDDETSLSFVDIPSSFETDPSEEYMITYQHMPVIKAHFANQVAGSISIETSAKTSSSPPPTLSTPQSLGSTTWTRGSTDAPRA